MTTESTDAKNKAGKTPAHLDIFSQDDLAAFSGLVANVPPEDESGAAKPKPSAGDGR